MLVSHRLISVPLSSSSPRSLFNLTLLSHHRLIASSSALPPSSRFFRDSFSASPMHRRKGNRSQQQWKVKTNPSGSSPLVDNASDTATESIADRLGELSVADGIHSVPAVHVRNASPLQHSLLPGQKVLWKPKSYGTVRGTTPDSQKLEEAGTLTKDEVASASEKQNAALSKLFGGSLLDKFTVDNSTYSQAQIRATFYPKFENEKSDQEIRTRMIEMVSSKGLATMEVSLKHSGSLFMYAGHNGGAYAKNSFGNIYTSVGVFVLGRMLKEAWGLEANRKQAEFNEFLERNRMCISMELVTAVLGDHGQRPREDYENL